MAVKVFFYTLRPYDEQGILEDLAKQRGIEYGYTEAYPTMENAQLAAGYDAVSLTPCDMSAPMLQRFHDLGVKAICCRSIGYDHVDLEKARFLLRENQKTSKCSEYTQSSSIFQRHFLQSELLSYHPIRCQILYQSQPNKDNHRSEAV